MTLVGVALSIVMTCVSGGPTVKTDRHRYHRTRRSATMFPSQPDCEVVMAHALTHFVGASTLKWQRTTAVDDPLDAVRGILTGAFVSMLGFWIPLALMLLQ